MTIDAVPAGLVEEEHREMDLNIDYLEVWSRKIGLFSNLPKKLWSWYFNRFPLWVKYVLLFQEVPKKVKSNHYS